VVPVVGGIVPVIVCVPLKTDPQPLTTIDWLAANALGLASIRVATLSCNAVPTTGAVLNHKY
jgi:hypothetical protein